MGSHDVGPNAAGRPRVSIGMPVYNGEEFLEEAIHAILNQSFPNLELVICDNASTDATEEICRQIARLDERVRYYPNPKNIGVTSNYNRTFELARGDYFKWASCNDYCAPELIERCVDVLDRRLDVVLSFPRTRLFDTDRSQAVDYDDDCNLDSDDPIERFEQLIDRLYSKLNNVMNGLIRADAVRKTHLHKAFAGSDYSLVAELILLGKFIQVPEPLFYRRVNAKAHSRVQSASEMQRRLWPDNKGAVLFQTWRLHSEYIRNVRHAPLGFRQKARLYYLLARRVNWRKRELARELAEAVWHAG